MRYRAVAFAMSLNAPLIACALPAALPSSLPTHPPRRHPQRQKWPFWQSPALGSTSPMRDISTLSWHKGIMYEQAPWRSHTLGCHKLCLCQVAHSDGLHRNAARGVAIDGQGNVWFGTDDPGESVCFLLGLLAVSRFEGQSWTTPGITAPSLIWKTWQRTTKETYGSGRFAAAC